MNTQRIPGKHLLTVMLLCTSFLLIPAASGPGAELPEPLPSKKDFQDMLAARQYQTCLQQISRVLRLKGDPAARYDHYELLMLRGECLLQLRDDHSAQRAFEQARRSPDPLLALQAHGLLVLLRATHELMYIPPRGEPIDIVPADGRSKAAAMQFVALYEMSTYDIKSAQAAQSREPLIALLPKLLDLEGLATLAPGIDQELRPDLARLGQRARELLAREVQSLEYKSHEIERHADEEVGLALPGSPWWTYSVRRGLTTPDRHVLPVIADQASQLARSADHGRMLAQAFRDDVTGWQKLADRAISAARHAQELLDDG